jgi:hypothetical protein
MLGTIVGFCAAIIGAIILAFVNFKTNNPISWTVIALGFLVGYAVRTFGKGSDRVFGVVGAVISLIGCKLTDLAAFMLYYSSQGNIPLLTLFPQMAPGFVLDLVIKSFYPMDALYYPITAFIAYKVSIISSKKEKTEAK